MTRSRPIDFRVTQIILWVFLTFALLVVLVIEWLTDWMGMDLVAQYFLTVFAIVPGLLMILVEVPEVNEMTIVENKIILRNLLTGKTKDISLQTIDGFKISTQVLRYAGLHFKLILLEQGMPLGSISLRYIDNLHEIITELEKQLTNSTEDEYGLLQRLREQQEN